ncbi:hypothetical protein OPV22_014626 [Ensete ventricosum]|uniref:Uncharacterized protein n=1 Tax=Ensete ventricosum TaxID=4639 RepID=A0AAV8R816_ENSVE|nr:hypothetical protein OPV22_014626 [Ensete ventricosum]
MTQNPSPQWRRDRIEWGHLREYLALAPRKGNKTEKGRQHRGVSFSSPKLSNLSPYPTIPFSSSLSVPLGGADGARSSIRW